MTEWGTMKSKHKLLILDILFYSTMCAIILQSTIEIYEEYNLPVIDETAVLMNVVTIAVIAGIVIIVKLAQRQYNKKLSTFTKNSK